MEKVSKGSDNLDEYFCDICDYKTAVKSNFTKHCLTAKHVKLSDLTNAYKNVSESATQEYNCKTCNKVYKSRMGLWQHAKRCTTPTVEQPPLAHQPDVVIRPSLPVIDTAVILDVIRENQEFKTMLYEQSKNAMEMQEKQSKQLAEIQEKQSKQLAEMQEKQSEILLEFKKENSELINKLIEREPCSTVNNTNNNQKFNLNFFLNETCKDAMNMEEFLAGLQFTFEDLMKFGDYGFVDGMSQFLIKELAKLDVTKRPIHCTDVRRDVIHLKDNNVWKKDTGQVQLAAAIKRAEFKSVVALRKWCDENPDSYINNSPNNLLRDKIYMQTLLGDDDTRNKVIKLLNKAMYLDRSNI
jgi:hypothetical protein